MNELAPDNTLCSIHLNYYNYDIISISPAPLCDAGAGFPFNPSSWSQSLFGRMQQNVTRD